MRLDRCRCILKDMSGPVVSRRQAGVSIVPGLRSDPLMLGSSLADVFRTPDYDCRVVDGNQRPEFAVTRLRSGPREMEKAPAYPPDKAVLICVSLTPASIGQWRGPYQCQRGGGARAVSLSANFIDLEFPRGMWVRGTFDLPYPTSPPAFWRWF